MGMITQLIKNIGKPAQTLVDSGLIEDGAFEHNFEGEDTFYAYPDKGLLLAFDDTTRILKSVEIALLKVTSDTIVYTGEMPSPFALKLNKSQVREILGTPDKSADRITIPTIGVVGGYDNYINRLSEYENLKIRCLYSAEYNVRSIIFESLPSAN